MTILNKTTRFSESAKRDRKDGLSLWISLLDKVEEWFPLFATVIECLLLFAAELLNTDTV